MRRLLVIMMCLLPLPVYAAQVQEVISPGGFKAWLVEEHALPLVAVKVAFRDAGSAYDPKGKEGLASMTAALMIEGAGEMDSHAFNSAIENHAIQMTFGADDDYFRMSFETLSEHTDKAFDYFAMAITRPRFDTSAVERVRAQTLAGLKEQEHQPGYLMHRRWEKIAFGDHTYGREAAGNSASVKSISKADMAHFAQKYLSKENMVISVVGDVTPKELAQLLDAHLGKLTAHYTGDVTVPETTLPATGKQEVIDYDIPQTMVHFGMNGMKRDNPDYYAAYVMNEILGGGGALTSKLGQEIREKRGLAYSVYTQMEPFNHAAVFGGGFATRNEQVGEALKALRATLDEFAKNGPSDKDIADAKQHLTGSFVLGLDSNGDIASFLSNMQLQHLGRDYLEKRNSYIEAVTKEQVTAVTKKLINPNGLLVVMVGKPNLASK